MNKDCQVLTLIFDNTDDGILFCDTKGIIQLWNTGCEKIFGYTQSEAIGKTLDIIIPEKYRNIHWDGFFKAVEKKQSKYQNELLSVPALGKNNKSISIEFSIALVSSNETLLGFGAIIRDVTKQFQEKKQLKKELEELKDKLRQV